MSLGSTTSRMDYTGTGSTATFAYTFKIFAKTDLVVIKRVISSGVETVLTVDTDYTVTGVGLSTGGNVTLTAGNLPNTAVLTIRRVVPLIQDTKFRDQAAFYPEVHENAFDKVVMIAQQLNDVTARSIRIADSVSPSSFNPTLPANIGADQTLTINSSGTGLALGPTPAQLSSAAAAASGATTAAAAAAVSETNAAASATTAQTAATSATNDATIAANHRTTSQRWASLASGTVVDVVTGVDSGLKSAKQYAQDAASSATTAQTAAAAFPAGGTTGQVLTKTSNTDYATNWTTVSGASGITALTGDVSATGPGSAAATISGLARTKLASGTINHVIINDGSGVLSSEATLAKSRGGTGANNSSVTFPSTGTIPTVPASGVVKSSGTALTSANVDLTSEVTGALPIGNGGTGQTSATAGLNALLPTQASQSGKVLQTDGTSATWQTVSGASPLTTKGDVYTFSTVNARLPVGINGQVLVADSTQTVGIKWGQENPAGAVQMYAGSTAPSGWLLCDGSAVSRTTYAALFAIVSTTYGAGDGSTTFNVPDTRGIFVRGAGTQTISSIGYSGTLGTKQGDQFQGHFHSLDQTDYDMLRGATSAFSHTSGAGANQFTLMATSVDPVKAPKTDGTNGTPRTGSETRPANIALNYIIRT